MAKYIKENHYCQQLGFRCVRSANNETRVERNRLYVHQPMHLS